MMNSEKKISRNLSGMLIGGAVGSAFLLLYAPKRGKELRDDIKSEIDITLSKAKETGEMIVREAKLVAEELVAKAEEILSASKKYAEGRYSGSLVTIEREIRSFKAALNAVVQTYKQNGYIEKTSNKTIENPFLEYDDLTLPKHEGMRRRRLHYHF